MLYTMYPYLCCLVCMCVVLSMYGVCVCVFDTTYSSMLWWNQVCSVEVPLCVCVCVCVCAFVVSLIIVLSFHVQNID